MSAARRPAPTDRGPNRKDLAAMIKDRVAVSDLVGKTVRLSALKRGDRWGLCPFHKEKTPSFTVNDDKKIFKCFGCGAAGSVIDFAMKFYGIDFAEAVNRLAQENGLDGLVEDPKMKAERERRDAERREAEEMDRQKRIADANRMWTRAAREIEATPVWSYLAGRGLDVERLGAAGHLRAIRYAGVMTYNAQKPGGPGDKTDWPVMLAAMQRFDATTGESPIVAVHRTFLMQGDDLVWVRARVATPDGGYEKLAKKMLGDPAGAAIRFTPAQPVMNAGEGIETMLSVLQGAERPEQGFWAGGALDLLPQVMFPPIVEQANLWTDNDMKSDVGANRMRARALENYAGRGLGVREFLAPKGCDWNDVLCGKGKGGSA